MGKYKYRKGYEPCLICGVCKKYCKCKKEERKDE